MGGKEKEGTTPFFVFNNYRYIEIVKKIKEKNKIWR